MKPLIVGIAGGSGSGKSTVARNVAAVLGGVGATVAFVDMDAYYVNLVHLSYEERRLVNWDHPDALEWELFVSQLGALARGESIEKPKYDFVQHLRARETVAVRAAPVVIVDGILLFVDDRVRQLCDIKVFVDTDADIRLIRRLQRDLVERGRPLDEIIDQYLTTVRPMHLEFVEPSKRYADVIVPRGGHDETAIEMIVATIRSRASTAG